MVSDSHIHYLLVVEILLLKNVAGSMQHSVYNTKHFPNDTYIAIINIIVNSQLLGNSPFGKVWNCNPQK